jgi:hypothetical protein
MTRIQDLKEIIELQAELIGNDGKGGNDAPSPAGQGHSGGSVALDKTTWKVIYVQSTSNNIKCLKVGDRCLAPTKNGQRHVCDLIKMKEKFEPLSL